MGGRRVPPRAGRSASRCCAAPPWSRAPCRLGRGCLCVVPGSGRNSGQDACSRGSDAAARGQVHMLPLPQAGAWHATARCARCRCVCCRNRGRLEAAQPAMTSAGLRQRSAQRARLSRTSLTRAICDGLEWRHAHTISVSAGCRLVSASGQRRRPINDTSKLHREITR